jgi:hypothetical protein
MLILELSRRFQRLGLKKTIDDMRPQLAALCKAAFKDGGAQIQVK